MTRYFIFSFRNSRTECLELLRWRKEIDIRDFRRFMKRSHCLIHILLLLIILHLSTGSLYAAPLQNELLKKIESAADTQTKLEMLDEALQDESIKGPLQAQLFFQRGLIYKNQKDYFRAIEDFDSSLGISRRNFQALIEKAECLIGVDQLDQASLALDTYLLNMPGAARAYVLKGLIFEKDGSLIRAEDEFTRALNFDPHSALALEHRSRLYLREGKPRKALEDIKTWSKISPNNPDLFIFRAEVQIRLRDFESALADYSRAEALRPDDMVRKQKTLLYLKIDKPDAALSAANKILQDRPEDLGALILAARSQTQSNRFKLADSLLKKALKLNPNLSEANLFMGVLKGKQGDYDEALEYLNRALELDPKSSDAYKERARIFFRLNDYLRSEVDLNAALENDPSDAEIFSMRALTFYRRMLYDAAIQDFSTVLEALPNDSRALFNRAVCNLKRDEPEMALADINNLLRQFPDNARALNLRGVVHASMGKDQQAMSDLNASTLLMPADPALWNNSGFYKFKKKNYQGARDDFLKALELDPQFFSARNNLAQTYDRMSETPPVEDVNSNIQEKRLWAH